MILPEQPERDEVDELLRNAQLRDELEPLLDDSVTWLNRQRVTIQVENEFLASILEWERAPIVPISKWFEPELVLPPHDRIDDTLLHEILWQTIRKLHSRRIVLDFTDHLSDRQLYCLIYRDILAAQEKKIERTDSYLHWDCSDAENDPETWLRYYASEEERVMWEDDLEGPLPPHEDPPYPRELPRAPM